VTEAQEAATKEKLRLEQQARRGTIRKSYGCLFFVVSPAWADPAGCFFVEAEDQAAAQQSLRSSTRRGTSKVRGASAPPATAEVGLASASPQAEKEAVQGLGQLRGEVTPPDTSSGAQPAALLKLKFSLRRRGG